MLRTAISKGIKKGLNESLPDALRPAFDRFVALGEARILRAVILTLESGRGLDIEKMKALAEEKEKQVHQTDS